MSSFCCDQCKLSFEQVQSLKNHFAEVHLKKSLQKCQFCQFSSYFDKELTRHVEKVHSGQKKYKKIMTSFKEGKDLNSNSVEVQKMVVDCNGNESSDIVHNDAQVHKSVMNPNEDTKSDVNSNLLHKSYETPKRSKSSITLTGSKSNVTPKRSNVFVTTNSFNSFATPISLNSFVTPKSSKSFVTPKNAKSVPTPKILKPTQTSKRIIAPKSLKSIETSKTLKSSESIVTPLSSKSTTTPKTPKPKSSSRKFPKMRLFPKSLYECELCQKQFKYRLSLRVHLSQTHVYQNMETCELCDFGSRSILELKTHMQTHLKPLTVQAVNITVNSKLFKCKQCKKKFSFWRSLKVHTANVHK